ncbi:hypothetical protein HPB49_019930 [Dermacentor silvarum]|uniref:Uncharacterized protein n=1 Tax=Dermacentor silvarum TaxID=543639 RepID=A0ACB8CZJ3_DERSI|nr:hypothetical protein HPB49_019930 [Dermacentor silvarum]
MQSTTCPSLLREQFSFTGLLMEKLQQQQGNDPPGSGEEEHPCPCCERVFPTAERLAVHVKVHRGGPKRPLKCKECCRTFPRIDKLRAHQVVHRVGKPYQCELCGKAFTFKQTLMEHLLRHTGERRHQCDLCPQSFYFRADLTSHRRRHSGERPFECRVCRRRFAGRADQLRHERLHDGDRPYHCPVCQRRFGRNSVLERHMMRHTGKRPYECHLCPNTFTRSYLLQDHLKDHPQPQRNLGSPSTRREMKESPRQLKITAAVSMSAVPGGHRSSPSPLSTQAVVAASKSSVPEEKPDSASASSAQEAAAASTLFPMPKEVPHSAPSPLHNANPPKEQVYERKPGNLRNVQAKQQQNNMEASDTSSAVVNNATPNLPSSSPPPAMVDMAKFKQASRVDYTHCPATIMVSPLSTETQTANLVSRAQPMIYPPGSYKILPSSSDPFGPRPSGHGLVVSSLGDHSSLLSKHMCEVMPQPALRDAAFLLPHDDTPGSHGVSEVEPQAVLGLSCPLWGDQDLQETNGPCSAELKDELNLMHSLSACPVVQEDMGRHSSYLSAALSLGSAWSKYCILREGSSS